LHEVEPTRAPTVVAGAIDLGEAHQDLALEVVFDAGDAAVGVTSNQTFEVPRASRSKAAT